MESPKPKSTDAKLGGSSFERGKSLSRRAHSIIPGGAHTYAKGDDQFPELAPPFIVRGEVVTSGISMVTNSSSTEWGARRHLGTAIDRSSRPQHARCRRHELRPPARSKLSAPNGSWKWCPRRTW